MYDFPIGEDPDSGDPANITDAVLKVGSALEHIAREISALGNADAATPMGGLEALGAAIREGLVDLTSAIDRME